MLVALATKILTGLGYSLVAAVAIFLFFNLNFFPTPDPDIFQYFGEGRQYMQLRLPKTIEVLPAYPILIGLVSKTLSSFHYPELLAAHVIIISSAVITLLAIFQFLKRISLPVATITLVLTATNPLFIFSSLNVNTEALFTAATLIIFLLYQKGRKTQAYVAAGFSFLIRYEGFVLLLSLLLTDAITKQFNKKTLRVVVCALLPIVVWVSAGHFRNMDGNIAGNFFVRQVIQHKDNLPQFDLYTHAPDYLINQTRFDMSQNRGVVGLWLYSTVLISAFILFKTKNSSYILMIAFGFLYLFFHVFFPYAVDRYFYPVLWIFYAIPLLACIKYCSDKNRVSLSFFFVSFCVYSVYILTRGNVIQTAQNYYTENSKSAYSRFARHEVRDAADWLNKQRFEKNTVVFAYEPWIIEYFVYNPNVTLARVSAKNHRACKNIECLILVSGVDPQQNTILYIQQSDSLRHDESFPSATDFNVDIFNDPIGSATHPSFTLLTHLVVADTWAKIYQYKPVSSL